MISNDALKQRLDHEVKNRYENNLLAPMKGSALGSQWVLTSDNKWVVLAFDFHREEALGQKYYYLVGLVEEACVLIEIHPFELLVSLLSAYPNIPAATVFPINEYEGSHQIRSEIINLMNREFAMRAVKDFLSPAQQLSRVA